MNFFFAIKSINIGLEMEDLYKTMLFDTQPGQHPKLTNKSKYS